MKKIVTIIGARPQIIKASAISRTIATYFSDKLTEVIVHTGQHYDENMSEVFFKELGIPKPNYNLSVGSGKHGEQTAKMLTGIEEILLKEKPANVFNVFLSFLAFFSTSIFASALRGIILLSTLIGKPFSSFIEFKVLFPYVI